MTTTDTTPALPVAPAATPPTWARPGKRGRIGVIQPAPGVLLEYEWPLRLPADMLFPVARIRMRGATAAHYQEIAEQSPEYAKDLVTAGADVIAYACSVGSLFAGAAAERALMQQLAAASGKPVVSLSDASMQALRLLGAKNIAILTPYNAETNALVSGYAEECGFMVVAALSLPVSIITISNLPADEIAALSIAALDSVPDADALWIPCSAVRTLEAISAIEAATGKIVVSGSQALLWAALRAIGVEDRLAGTGRLFQR